MLLLLLLLFAEDTTGVDYEIVNNCFVSGVP